MNAGFFSLFHFATADYILVLNVRNTHNNSKCCLSLFSMLPQASSTQRNLSYAHKPIRNINRSVRRVISFLCVCILKSFITFRGFCYVCTRTCMNSSMHLFLLSLHILSVKLALVMIVFFVTDPSSKPRQKQPTTDLCYKTEISSLMDFNSPDASLDKGKPWSVLLDLAG